MKETGLYLMDSDVFISGKNQYYAFNICPGFWRSLIHHYQASHIASIDKVRNELLAGRKDDDLVKWVKDVLPAGFFRKTHAGDVVAAYREVMLWVQQNPQFLDPAKAKFATEADGWLVAYAMIHGAIVVTNEQPSPGAKNRVKLPDVCVQFEVTYKDTFLMLKSLQIRFEWAGTT